MGRVPVFAPRQAYRRRYFGPAGGGLLGLVSAVLVCGPAGAQTIDYGSLEQMFGEPVTTSATGKPQTASDAPANLVIVTAEDIRRSGARTISDVPSMVLKNYAGVDVQQVSAGVANVGVNGYNQPYSPRLLVLVNGRQVYLDHYGYTEWSTIPVELAEIKQIEIVKGPNSALFGFNAANGVINIVTVNPLYEQVNALDLSVGSQNSTAGSAVMAARPTADMGVRLSAGGERSHQFSGWQSVASDRMRPGRTSVSGDWVARIGDGVETEVEATRSTSDALDILQNFAGAESRYATWSLKGAVAAATPAGQLSLQLYHNDLSLDSMTGWGGGGGGWQVNHYANGVTSFQASDLVRINAGHALREAVEYRRNELTSGATGGGTIGYDVLSNSLMWDWQVLPDLAWTNAGRVDHLSLDRSGPLPGDIGVTNRFWRHSLVTYSYNSGAVLKITDADSLRLTAAQAVEAPSLLEYGLMGRLPGTGTVLVGNPALKPTIERNIQIGYGHDFRSVGLSLSGAVYRQDTRDINSLDFGSSAQDRSLTMLSGNIGSSHETGLEVTLGWRPTPALRFDGNYTFSDITDDKGGGQSQGGTRLYGGGDGGGFPPPSSSQPNWTSGGASTPAHKVNLHAGWTAGRWDVDGYGHYVSQIYQQSFIGGGVSTERIPGYVELDLRIAYRVCDGVQLAVTGTSVDLARHSEDSGPAVGRRIAGTLSVRY